MGEEILDFEDEAGLRTEPGIDDADVCVGSLTTAKPNDA